MSRSGSIYQELGTCLAQLPDTPPVIVSQSGWQDYALAGGLGVEQTIRFLGLVQPPTMGKEFINVNIVVGDELGAVGLPLRREGPGAD